ncbi:hypothetical protein RM780_11435 [Streptomyces sp. DSM 44917]|uniref:DUF3558 domain-containing protein n=1 Tax=Streptomyces boetiae TaxID=3075541 RepID=A0ABU2L8F8_9ACTN|nr:hypothetical protein [Streptomyces sp. DSM 44917]MDT0307573.1 hypothetical protein [Streptomyces sp. DSM 44917]
MLALSALAVCSACSSGAGEEGTREYSVPNPLCTVELPAGLYDPVYPPGEAAEVVREFLVHSDETLSPVGECVVAVDGTTAVSVDASASSDGGIAPGVAPYLHEFGYDHAYDLADAESFTEGPRETAVWADFAVTHVACVSSPELDLTGVTVSIRLDWAQGGPDRREELRELIGPYADAYLARLAPGTCEGG